VKYIEFNDDGVPYADGKAEAAALEFLKDDTRESVTVSTSNLIMAVRALVYEGKFPYDQVTFRYHNHEMVMDRNARLRDWPNGFCDHNDDWLGRLLNPRS